jgi:hypothetical protein
MKQKTAKIAVIRKAFDIPEQGFASQGEALNWYKAHFRDAKGRRFNGGFGFRYDPVSNRLEFDYKSSPGGFSLPHLYPLDNEVPFDREVSALAEELELPEWLAPALRPVVLMARLSTDSTIYVPDMPSWLIASVGQFRLLLQPATNLSLRQWRERGEYSGILRPEFAFLWQKPKVVQMYGEKKAGKKQELYWQTIAAYSEVCARRRDEGRQGKRGILQDTGRLLVKKFGWPYEPDPYTVSRYLDRATQRWYIMESRAH